MACPRSAAAADNPAYAQQAAAHHAAKAQEMEHRSRLASSEAGPACGQPATALHTNQQPYTGQLPAVQPQVLVPHQATQDNGGNTGGPSAGAAP